MSQNPNTSEDLERLLNAWGRSKSAPSWRWWQWMPLVAAVVVAGAGIVMLTRASRQAEPPPMATAVPASAQIQDLQARLTGTEGRLDQLRRLHEETKRENDRLAGEVQQAHQVRDELAAARSDVARLSRTEIEDQGTIQEMLAALGTMDETNKSLTARLAEVQTQLDTAQQTAQSAEKLRTETAALRQEHQLLSERLEALQQSQLRLASAETAAWQAAVDAKEAKVGASGLAAMQAAVKATALLDQAADAAKLSDAKTVDVVHKLETVLNRLSMADPADEYEQAWADETIRGELPGEVAAALAEADERKLPDDVKSFLIQAQVILRRGACGG